MAVLRRLWKQDFITRYQVSGPDLISANIKKFEQMKERV